MVHNSVSFLLLRDMSDNILFFFHCSQPVPWKLLVAELFTGGVQQSLFDVNLLYGERKVPRECSSVGGNGRQLEPAITLIPPFATFTLLSEKCHLKCQEMSGCTILAVTVPRLPSPFQTIASSSWPIAVDSWKASQGRQEEHEEEVIVSLVSLGVSAVWLTWQSLALGGWFLGVCIQR